MAVAVNCPVSGTWLQQPQETTTGTRTLSGQSWKGRPSLSSRRQESKAREGESRSRKRAHRVSPGQGLRGKWGQLRKGQVRMEALPPGDTAPREEGSPSSLLLGDHSAPHCFRQTPSQGQRSSDSAARPSRTPHQHSRPSRDSHIPCLQLTLAAQLS